MISIWFVYMFHVCHMAQVAIHSKVASQGTRGFNVRNAEMAMYCLLSACKYNAIRKNMEAIHPHYLSK
jgi:hypothetical protein